MLFFCLRTIWVAPVACADIDSDPSTSRCTPHTQLLPPTLRKSASHVRPSSKPVRSRSYSVARQHVNQCMSANSQTESNGVEIAISAVFLTSTRGITTSVQTSAAIYAASSRITKSPPVPRNLYTHDTIHLLATRQVYDYTFTHTHSRHTTS
jgi:hypothetical protein